MLQVIKRRIAIRSYRKKLGPYLERQFGWQANYSPKQVRSGASSLRLSIRDICYAYAMYCTPVDFNSHHAATGEHCDYATMHAETMSFGTGSQVESSSHHHSGSGWFDSHGHDSGSHDSGGSDGGGGDGGSD
jgi:uncharacterized membrane protein YgcG